MYVMVEWNICVGRENGILYRYGGREKKIINDFGEECIYGIVD